MMQNPIIVNENMWKELVSHKGIQKAGEVL